MQIDRRPQVRTRGPDQMSAARLVVTVVGSDRPGIVAGVTRGLYEAGCNLEDATSTILSGHFAMMMLVRSPEAEPAVLEGRLAPVAHELGLILTVRPVAVAEPVVAPPTHMVAVYGADQPGIVYRVADRLAAAGANITDLTSRIIGAPDRPVYALMLEVAYSGGPPLEAILGPLKDELGVDVSVHPLESDVL